MQHKLSEGAIKFIKFYTGLGGGKELSFWTLVVLFTCKREYFFYALFVTFVYSGFTGYLKLAYAEPRPFWLSEKVQVIGKCES